MIAVNSKLGREAEDLPSLIRQIKRGLPYKLLVQFQEASDLELETIARAIQLPARTMARRKARGRLSSDESERLLRLASLFEQAVELFEGDAAGARRWLTSPNRALGGESPLSFAETEPGAREVERLIGRLEHGVIT